MTTPTNLSSNEHECVPRQFPFCQEHLEVLQGTLPITVSELILQGEGGEGGGGRGEGEREGEGGEERYESK